MFRKPELQFNINAEKRMREAIRKKRDELEKISQDVFNAKKQKIELDESVAKQREFIDTEKEKLSKEIKPLEDKRNLLIVDIDKLEKDFKEKQELFSLNINKKNSRIKKLDKDTDELENKLQPILEVELDVLESEKAKLNKEVLELSEQKKQIHKQLNQTKKENSELVEKNKEEEIRLDKKLEELSLREAENEKKYMTLVKHAKRINKIYQRLGKDNIVINI